MTLLKMNLASLRKKRSKYQAANLRNKVNLMISCLKNAMNIVKEDIDKFKETWDKDLKDYSKEHSSNKKGLKIVKKRRSKKSKK